jgi:Flp pilus assembly protein TadD
VAVEAPSPPPSALPSSAPVASEDKVASARALREESLALLEKSKDREAMTKATAAMEADPTNAMPYLVLGSALQDIGHWREARNAYELCVKNATRGMVEECHAMLRRR